MPSPAMTEGEEGKLDQVERGDRARRSVAWFRRIVVLVLVLVLVLGARRFWSLEYKDRSITFDGSNGVGYRSTAWRLRARAPSATPD